MFVDTFRDRLCWIRHWDGVNGQGIINGGVPIMWHVPLEGGTRSGIVINDAFTRQTPVYCGQTYARDIDKYFVYLKTTETDGTDVPSGTLHDELWQFDPTVADLDPQLVAWLQDATPNSTQSGVMSGFGYMHSLGGLIVVREGSDYQDHFQTMRFYPTRNDP
jgi:hypothetical protein